MNDKFLCIIIRSIYLNKIKYLRKIFFIDLILRIEI
jgi:hypothetical protein